MIEWFSGLHFDTVFEILAAFEAFTTWRARSFIGDPTPSLGKRPTIDTSKCVVAEGDVKNAKDMFKAAGRIFKTGVGYCIKTFWFMLVSGCKCLLTWCGLKLHNGIGIGLKFSPIFALPIYVSCYFCGFGFWSCVVDKDGNFIITKAVAFSVFLYIVIKAILYTFCAILNRHMNDVNGVEVEQASRNDFLG